jgi:hypothetical protein
VRIPIADCHYIGVRGNKTIVFVPIDVPRNRWFPSHPQNICVTRKRFLSKLGNCGCILTLILLEEAVIRGFNSSTPTAIKKKKNMIRRGITQILILLKSKAAAAIWNSHVHELGPMPSYALISLQGAILARNRSTSPSGVLYIMTRTLLRAHLQRAHPRADLFKGAPCAHGRAACARLSRIIQTRQQSSPAS